MEIFLAVLVKGKITAIINRKLFSQIGKKKYKKYKIFMTR